MTIDANDIYLYIRTIVVIDPIVMFFSSSTISPFYQNGNLVKFVLQTVWKGDGYEESLSHFFEDENFLKETKIVESNFFHPFYQKTQNSYLNTGNMETSLKIVFAVHGFNRRGILCDT